MAGGYVGSVPPFYTGRNMLRIYAQVPFVAQEQADVLRPLIGGLLSHLDADPAVRARAAALQIQLLLQ